MGLSKMAPAVISLAMAGDADAATQTPSAAQSCAAAIQQMQVADQMQSETDTTFDTVVCGYGTVDTLQPDASGDGPVDEPTDYVTLQITGFRDEAFQRLLADSVMDGEEDPNQLGLGCQTNGNIWAFDAMDPQTGEHGIKKVAGSAELLAATAKNPVPVRLSFDPTGADFGGVCISSPKTASVITDVEGPLSISSLASQVAVMETDYEKGLDDLTITNEQLEGMLETLTQLRAQAMTNYAANKDTVKSIDDLTGRARHLLFILVAAEKKASEQE